MLRTIFKGLRPAETLSSLFLRWTAGERECDRCSDECIEYVQQSEERAIPLITSKGNNPYLRKLLDIKLYLDCDLVLRHGCLSLEELSEINSSDDFLSRVKKNGEQAMREYCDEISNLESENLSKNDEQEEISKTSMGSLIKHPKDDENSLRWLLDYTLYNYVMEQLEELLVREEFIENAETQDLDGLYIREKFIHIVWRRGIRALKEFDGDDDVNEEEEKDDNPKCKVPKISQPEDTSDN